MCKLEVNIFPCILITPVRRACTASLLNVHTVISHSSSTIHVSWLAKCYKVKRSGLIKLQVLETKLTAPTVATTSVARSNISNWKNKFFFYFQVHKVEYKQSHWPVCRQPSPSSSLNPVWAGQVGGRGCCREWPPSTTCSSTSDFVSPFGNPLISLQNYIWPS